MAERLWNVFLTVCGAIIAFGFIASLVYRILVEFGVWQWM